MSGFGTAVGLGLQAANLYSQVVTRERNIDFQREQNRQNRQWALEQWNRENAYNHPAAQLARLREAGLNPQLMYGDGAAGMPAATAQSPEQIAPQGKPVQIDPMVAANLELVKSQAEKNRADAAEAESRVPTYEKQMQLVDSQIELNSQLGAKAMSEADLNKRFGEKVSAELRQMSVDYDFAVRSLEDRLKSVASQATIDSATADQIVEQLYGYRHLVRAQAQAALASASLDWQTKAQIERQLDFFNQSFDDNLAIIRENKYSTRNQRIYEEVYGGKLRQSQIFMNNAAGYQSAAGSAMYLEQARFHGMNSWFNGIANSLDAGAGLISSIYGQGTLYQSRRMASRPMIGFNR